MIKIFIKWLAIFALKMILLFALLVLVAKVKANDVLKTGLTYHAVAIDGKGWNTGAYMAYPYFDTNPYKPKKYSSTSNRMLAPAYRMRQTPRLTIKTNLLHDLTTSLNLGVEIKMGQKLTLDLPFTLNPWTYNKEENTKFKFLLIQPELRFWTCEAFNGHFFGVHGQYAYYNVGHLPTPLFSETMNLYRFEGQLAGAGISYGYQWLINPRWSIEAEIGAGYARLWYDKYPCQSCAKLITSETKNYWGVTRAGISLIYNIK
jgi:hypothetical protein